MMFRSQKVPTLTMVDKRDDTLQLRIPATLKRSLAVEAARKGVTIRSVVLGVLASAGYPIAEDEIRDKRKARQ